MMKSRTLGLTAIAAFSMFAHAIGERQAGEPAGEIEAYLKARTLPLETAADLDPLLKRIGQARIVLLGESSHGTSEFYTWRAAITRRLIAEKGFRLVVVEGDWPSCWQVNRHIKHLPDAPGSARAALAAFRRWPRWMWANEEIVALVEWLARHNASLPARERVGFFGMDVYSVPESMDAVFEYAHRHAPDISNALHAAYQCLAPFRDNMHNYARQTRLGRNSAKQTESALNLLKENAGRLAERDPVAFFNAKQNAYVVKRAEMHFRAMAAPQDDSWNKRAEHMKATLARLLDFHGPHAKAIVWAHNTHIGDARATDMAAAGMKNIGWLAREAYGAENVVAVGLTTHRGRVLAGRQWGAPAEIMTIPDALAGSVEDIFNRLGRQTLLVVFDNDVPQALNTRLGHRAKGVVYHPETERRNYVPTVLPRRYDAFIFIAETTPLTPLGEPSAPPPARPSVAAPETDAAPPPPCR